MNEFGYMGNKESHVRIENRNGVIYLNERKS